MKMKRYSILMILLMFAGGRYATAAENVKFSGTLVSLPCTIPDSDQKIVVHMGMTNAHDLYLNQAMPRLPFVLHLEDCDPTIASRVRVTFSGAENPALPGALATDDGASGSQGIAIGLEDSNGAQIKVNQAMAPHELIEGNNVLSFRAYIAGEPDRIKDRSINTGTFNASAIVEVAYE